MSVKGEQAQQHFPTIHGLVAGRVGALRFGSRVV
jgi:hypothetical protein